MHLLRLLSSVRHEPKTFHAVSHRDIVTLRIQSDKDFQLLFCPKTAETSGQHKTSFVHETRECNVFQSNSCSLLSAVDTEQSESLKKK